MSETRPDTPAPTPAKSRPVLPRLPIAYFALAHACLALAALALVLRPASFTGFYYHPKMVAVVHLVTLGWITASILGALYLVAPLAFRTPIEVRRLDVAAFVLFLLGATGIPSHFWIDELTGVAWSGLFLILAFLRVGWVVLANLRDAPIPGFHRLGLGLAFGNILLAALAGTSLGINKFWPFLPGRQLDNVHGHAHLAALGWGLMVILAVGYRLLPMLLPSAMPRGCGVWASLLLLQAGAMGLFVTFHLGGRGLEVAAGLAVLGVLTFLDRLRWMLGHRKRPAKGLPRPEPGVVQVLLAMVCLLGASVLGLLLALRPTTTETLRWCAVYGVLGLLGVFGQLVAGVAFRLAPLYTWLRAFGRGGHKTPPPSPHGFGHLGLQWTVVVAWATAVASLAVGLYFESVVAVRVGGTALLLATGLGVVHHARVLRHLAGSEASSSAVGSEAGSAQTRR